MILGRKLDKLPQQEKLTFERHALYVMPKWKDTVPITVKYLKWLGNPVVRVQAKYEHPGRTNHMIKECNLPGLTALAVGAYVMLLLNYVVEEEQFNGQVGKVVKIIYSDPMGPRVPGLLPWRVVVDFPGVKFEPGKEWNSEHPTWVPIDCETLRCEKRCCSITTIPLRVCKAITTYKSQGLTVGEKEMWEKIMLVIGAAKGLAAKPGIEQVSFSRSREILDMAVDGTEEHPLTKERIRRIGKSPGYNQRRLWVDRVRELHNQTVPMMKKMIAEHDESQGEKTFDGGYDALVKWYRSLAGYGETADSGGSASSGD